MKNTTYKFSNLPPYSLHDCSVNRIDASDEKITLYFKDGFEKNTENFTKVKGKVYIENPDLDFCCVEVLGKNGYYGKFNGKKLSLPKFISLFKKYEFEVVDQTYGFNRVQYSGFITYKKKSETITREMEICLYFTGNIVYLTEE